MEEILKKSRIILSLSTIGVSILFFLVLIFYPNINNTYAIKKIVLLLFVFPTYLLLFIIFPFGLKIPIKPIIFKYLVCSILIVLWFYLLGKVNGFQYLFSSPVLTNWLFYFLSLFTSILLMIVTNKLYLSNSNSIIVYIEFGLLAFSRMFFAIEIGVIFYYLLLKLASLF